MKRFKRYVVIDSSIALHFVMLAHFPTNEMVLYLPMQNVPDWLISALSETPKKYNYTITIVRDRQTIRNMCPRLKETTWNVD